MGVKKNPFPWMMTAVQYIFETLLFACVLFFIAEVMERGLVVYYFSYPWLLTLTAVFGMILVVFSKREPVEYVPTFIKLLGRGLVVMLIASLAGFLLMMMVGGETLLVYRFVPWLAAAGIVSLGFLSRPHNRK